MATRQGMLMELALEVFGSHDAVRDELNAVPEEYQAWLGGTPMPAHIRERLIALLVRRQAQRVQELRRQR